MRMFLFLFLAFAMMFGSVVAPAMAHNRAAAADLVVLEVVDHQEVGCPEDSRSSPDKGDHIGHHHHCSAGIKVCASALAVGTAHVRVIDRPLTASPLPSRAISPLAEPPAA